MNQFIFTPHVPSSTLPFTFKRMGNVSGLCGTSQNYEYREVEARWQQTWKDEDVYFKEGSEKPQFVIDTPPPYPTGEFLWEMHSTGVISIF